MALVKFIEDDGACVAKGGIGDEATGEDSLGQEAEASARSTDIFEADLVADGFADAFAHFVRDAASSQAGRDATGFEDEHFSAEWQERAWFCLLPGQPQ